MSEVFLSLCWQFLKSWNRTRNANNNSIPLILGVQDTEDDNILLVNNFLGTGEKHVRPQNYELTIDRYSDEDFFRLFRMKKTTFNTLVNLVLQTTPEFNTIWVNGLEPMTATKKVLVALMHMSSQEPMRKIGDRFNLCDSSVHRSINEFMECVGQTRDLLIRWPRGEDQALVSQQFEQIAHFKGVIGAIDGCHINCKVPKEIHNSYINRKMQKSIILQATCTSKRLFTRLFTSIFVGCPGRIHDARVLSMSGVFEDAAQLFTEETHLVGDIAYPLKPWLMTPFKKPRTGDGNLPGTERKYNKAHSKTRVCIENAFGLLKGRWRRLKYIDVYSIEKAIHIIQTACILHNFCLLEDDYIEMETMENEDDNVDDGYAPELHPSHDTNRALAKRNAIKNSLPGFA